MSLAHRAGRRRPNHVAVLAVILGSFSSLSSGHAQPRTIEKTATFSVSDSSPRYVINLVAILGDGGGDQMQSAELRISREGGPLLQTVKLKPKIGAERFVRSLIAEDLNFDGNLDLRTLRSFGAKWESYDVLFFDPRSKKFITNASTRELSKMRNLTVINGRREIIDRTHGPSQPSRRVFRYIGGTLTLQESCVFENDRDPQSGTVVSQRRVEGSMVTERAPFTDRSSPSPDPCSKLGGPGDPSLKPKSIKESNR